MSYQNRCTDNCALFGDLLQAELQWGSSEPVMFADASVGYRPRTDQGSGCLSLCPLCIHRTCRHLPYPLPHPKYNSLVRIIVNELCTYMYLHCCTADDNLVHFSPQCRSEYSPRIDQGLQDQTPPPTRLGRPSDCMYECRETIQSKALVIQPTVQTYSN